MNREDYETYIDYKQQKGELWGQCIDKYNKDIEKLKNDYEDSIDSIKEVEYIIKNKKTLGQIIGDTFLILMIELMSCIPFVMTKQGRINYLGDAIPIMFIVFGTLMAVMFLVEIKTSIECYIKYNKIIKK